MSRNLVIDCHADTLLKKHFKEMARLMFNTEQTYQVTKELLLQGDINVQVFALFIPPPLEKFGLEITLELIAQAKEMENKGDFTLIKSKTDLEDLKEDTDQLGMILSLEGAVTLERRLKILPIFYELGVRNIGLAWSRKNLFAEGSSFTETKTKEEGLSKHGEDLVMQMDSLGMVIDVSHLNTQGFNDVTKLTDNPFIASHSNAYKLCPISRNLTDNQLMDVASANGVVGINFYSRFLTKNNPEEASINDVIKHIKYIADLTSVNHVGLGSDFDGISLTPKGLENASKIKNIPHLLAKEGFSKQDIAKIMGGNFERVFKKVWK
ncbi:MAG: dipeptidase [Candidatus Hodarchaeota archaeon]